MSISEHIIDLARENHELDHADPSDNGGQPDAIDFVKAILVYLDEKESCHVPHH